MWRQKRRGVWRCGGGREKSKACVGRKGKNRQAHVQTRILILILVASKAVCVKCVCKEYIYIYMMYNRHMACVYAWGEGGEERVVG